MSTALGYLSPARHRLNLTIRADCMVHRLIFAGRRATGVEVESGGAKFVVEADEIVLSGGAIASPQLLMLSGIGPSEHLNTMNIPVVHDLPGVGKNFRDHPLVFITCKVKDGETPPWSFAASDAKVTENGYAFAEITPKISKAKSGKRVDIVLKIDKGSLVYFNRVEIEGNTRTRDNVIRRDLTVKEGGVFDPKAIRTSTQKLQRLGFFEDVLEFLEKSSSTPTNTPALILKPLGTFPLNEYPIILVVNNCHTIA